MTADPNRDFQAALGDDESLKAFLGALHDFEEEFCRQMFHGDDFTLKLEVRGRGHKLLHARTYRDHIRRPEEKQTAGKGYVPSDPTGSIG